MEDHIPTLKDLRRILMNSRKPGQTMMFFRSKRCGVHLSYCSKQSNPFTDNTMTLVESSQRCDHRQKFKLYTAEMDRRILPP